MKTTHFRRLAFIAAATLLFCMGGCGTIHRTSYQAVPMTSQQATTELLAWGDWLNAHPLTMSQKILLPEIDGSRWTFTKEGIKEEGVIPREPSVSYSVGAMYVNSSPKGERPYVQTALFNEVSSITKKTGFIMLTVRKPSETFLVRIPTSGRSPKTLISALLVVCPNVR